ncbi:hypothetical protein AOR13_3130 [Alteromonas stellipolaris LMG 21856]|jgi:hypothetical protein|nr:hypothetical protein AOR13_3130 [Alteromonas stellipolaris LMG 21856]
MKNEKSPADAGLKIGDTGIIVIISNFACSDFLTYGRW